MAEPSLFRLGARFAADPISADRHQKCGDGLRRSAGKVLAYAMNRDDGNASIVRLWSPFAVLYRGEILVVGSHVRHVRTSRWDLCELQEWAVKSLVR